jgi:hypothetical protein
MLQRLIIIAVTLVGCFAGGQVAAQNAIGAVSRMQGEASATRGGAARPLAVQESVFPDEIVSTGDAARLEVTFSDAPDARRESEVDARSLRLRRCRG